MCTYNIVMKLYLGLQVLALVNHSSGYPAELYDGSPCTMEDNSPGTCTKLQFCESRIEQIKKGLRLNIESGHCAWDGFDEIVCCGNPESKSNVESQPSSTVSDIKFQDQHEKHDGSPCTMEDNSPGICSKLQFCESRIEQIKKGLRLSFESGHCSWDGFDEIVCCSNHESKNKIEDPPTTPNITNIVFKDRPAKQACKDYTELHNQLTSMETMFHIIGGEEVNEGELPYVVALGYPSSEGGILYNCGGTLLTEKHVLTAAHCVNNIQNQVPVEIKAGTTNLTNTNSSTQVIQIAQIYAHPDYTFSANYHDIAVVELEKNVTLTKTVFPVCLQTQFPITPRNSPDNPYIVAGWGLTEFDGEKSPVLLKTPGLSVVSLSKCNSSYTNFRKLPNGLTDEMICIEDPNKDRGSDACQGDSGGPLLYTEDKNYELVGVTSFGRNCGSSVPSVYIKVLPYLEWIEDLIWQ